MAPAPGRDIGAPLLGPLSPRRGGALRRGMAARSRDVAAGPRTGRRRTLSRDLLGPPGQAPRFMHTPTPVEPPILPTPAGALPLDAVHTRERQFTRIFTTMYGQKHRARTRLPVKTQAVRMHEAGGPEVLRVEDVWVPDPGATRSADCAEGGRAQLPRHLSAPRPLPLSGASLGHRLRGGGYCGGRGRRGDARSRKATASPTRAPRPAPMRGSAPSRRTPWSSCPMPSASSRPPPPCSRA